ncbi:GerMN domain-containing protein [Streptomyces tubercidicus]
MTRPRAALTCCVLALVAVGCGIRPTGVTDGGTAPSGISKGMRIYFASDNGLRGVARPGTKIHDLLGAYKLLLAGPTPEERADGLTNLLTDAGPMSVTSHHGDVTIDAPRYVADPQNQSTGQLVCTFARAEVLLHGTRPDKVQVTIVGEQGMRAGPYQCQQFLTR